jgi:hypothetical protein
MRKRLGGLEGAYIWKGVGVSVLGSALMGGGLMGWQYFFENASAWVVLLGGLGVGLVIYVGVIWLLRIPELMGMINTIVYRLRKE